MGLPRNEEYVYYIEEPSNRTIYTPITGNPDEQASPTETSNASSDQSTGKTIPSINWDADNVTPVGGGSNGDEGVAPPSYPNVNPDPVPVIRYKTITRYTRVVVEDFSHSALEALHNQGVTFVVIYTDGTEDDVDWTEVYDPQVITTSSITFDADNIGAASNQHFWDDTNGAHVTDNEQDDWNAEYAKTGHGDLANPTDLEPWHNILMNSLGILLRRGLVNLVSFSKSAIAFYDGSGNQNGNITAFFGRNNAQIGKDTEKHLVINSSGITVYNGDGTVAPLQASNISAAEANIQQLQADTADITTIRANSAKVKDLTANQLNAASGYIENLLSANVSANQLNAASGYIESLTSSNVTANDISANKATIASLISGDVTVNTLRSASGYIGNLTSSNVSANDISANKATIESLISGNVTVNTIRAASAFIASLASSNISASNIVADHADISDLKATKVNVSDLEADYITASTIESTYMKADISNADVAWIQNGVIKDGSISNAMIASVSANKLTAGTIDASNITVTNLNADNITTGTINGQRIGEGSLSLSKLEDDVYTEAEVDAKLLNMQTQIDGAIETWTGTAVPTLNNTPASSWTDTATKHNHVGDVYFVVNSSSQQNGYNYRFTESGTYPNTTYSWQLIKDNDVTNALSRLTTAEGKIGTIEQFDSDISAWKTDTDEELATIKSNHTALAGRVTTAEGTLTTKVDTTTFNALSQTVEGNTSSIQSLTTEQTTLSGRIDNAQAAIDNIKIGGRNLLRKTGSFVAADIALTRSSVPETGVIRITSTSSAGYAKFKVDYLDFSEYGNDTYVVSFDARLAPVESSYTNANLIVYLGFSTANRINNAFSSSYDRYGGYTFEADKLSSDWQRFTKSYNVPGDIKTGQSSALVAGSQMSVEFSVGGARKPVEVRLVKLERGTRATDWTPAPEDVESQITKNTTKINEVSDTVDGHTQRIGSLETTIVTKADGSSLETVSNRLNSVSDTVDGHTQSITSINSTLSSKADGSTVSSLTTRVNNISDTVDGHTSSLSSITSTQTTIQQNAVKSTVQLWFTKANTTAPNKPTAHVTTNNPATGNAWNLAVPTYNASYPNYYYCYEYEYLNGSYGWSAVTRDIATEEAQERARTAITNAATADTKAGNAATAASNAQTSADNAQSTANKNVKETIQLWITKATNTSPAKPTTAITATVTTGNVWSTVVPIYNSTYPHYFYCMQYKLADGSYIWSDVVYDQATTEAQSVARTASSNLTTLQNDYATFKQTTQNFESTIGSTYATKQEVNSIEIGGRNILQSKVITDAGVVGSTKEFSLSPANLRTKFGNGKFFWDDFEEGVQYTFSVSAEATNPTQYAAGTQGPIFLFSYTDGSTNTYMRFYFGEEAAVRKTMTSNEGKTVAKLVGSYGSGADTWIYRELKLEKGNKATDWTPAPEDTNEYVSQMIQSNLAPFFSMPIEDIYNASTNPDGYWKTNRTSDTTQLADGWAHIERSNTGTSTAWPTFYESAVWRNAHGGLKPNKIYTVLIEIRNAVITGDVTISGITVNTNTDRSMFLNSSESVPVADGVYYVTADTKDDTTASNITNTTRSLITMPAGSSIACDLRMSLYEGRYSGPYKPYIPLSEALKSTSDIKSVTTRVTQAESTIEQHSTSIALKANSADVYTKQQSDGLISTEVTNRNAAITAATNAINLSVSEMYTTKQEFSDLEIGGRNLFTWPLSTVTKWKDEEHALTTYQNKESFTQFTGSLLFDPSETVGEQYTISFWAKSPNGTTALQLYNSNGTPKYFWFPAVELTSALGDEWEFFSHTVTNTEYTGSNTPSTNETYWRRIEIYAPSAIGVLVKQIKVEKGNKSTDWTPAPEDMATQIDLNAAKAEIKVTTDGISSEVSKVSSAKYVVSVTANGWPLSSIKTWAAEGYTGNWIVQDVSNVRVNDTVYVKGIDSTRNCDVYIKGTVTAINVTNRVIAMSSHGYEDVLPIETIKSTINQSSDSVKIQAKHVEIDGAAVFSNSAFKSAADAAYDAKGSAAAVQTNLNNLSVGGRNLLIDSGNMSNNRSLYPSEITVSNGIVTWSRTAVAWPWFVLTKTAIPIENIPAGKELILSLEIRKTTDEVQKVYVGLCTVSSINSPSPRLRYTSNAGHGHLDTVLEGMDVTSDWVRYKTRFSTDYDIWRVQTSTTEAGVIAYMYHNAVGTIQIRKPKLEFGNKDTDWTPAPEDVDSDISIAKTSADIVVSVYPVSIDWNNSTATLGVRCIQNGQIITPTGYSWTKDSLTTVLGSSATLDVTDLNAVYNCTVTFNV